MQKYNHHQKMLFITQTAIIAAVYTALTLVVPVASFGQIQLRISEALCILPLFTFSAVPGLTLGCVLANLVGFMMGLNPAGLTDVLFGSAATLLAAICTYWIGRTALSVTIKMLLAPLTAVVFNGIIIGIEIAAVFIGNLAPSVLFLCMAQVAGGELLSCYGIGIPLALLLWRTQLYRRLFRI